MSLTFLQIQNAVLADGFAEAKRADCKNWIQFRHAWLWDLEEWDFKFATTPVTFPNGAQPATGLPADFASAVAVYSQDGLPLTPHSNYRAFFDRYNALLENTFPPEGWTVLAGQLLIGPQGDGTTGLLVYQRAKPTLANDGDLTGLPEGYDVALVHGGKSEGFKLANVPLWQGFDDDFSAAADAMRRTHLTTVRADLRQMPSYQPDR